MFKLKHYFYQSPYHLRHIKFLPIRDPRCLHLWGLKRHKTIQVSVLFRQWQHLDISTQTLAAVNLAATAANLERAHFCWHEHFSLHSALGLCSIGLSDFYIKIIKKTFCGWEIDQKKQKHRGWMLVAEECVAFPWTAQRASYFIRTNKKILLTQFKYAHMRGENHSQTCYKLKATLIAANWEQLSGGDTN